MSRDDDDIAQVLSNLDRWRETSGEPVGHGGVIRERSGDGSEYRIVYSRCAVDDVDDIIRQEVASAEAGHYSLEWKLYGHDSPPDLADRLVAAGFEADPVESVLMLPLSAQSVARFEAPAYEVRRVDDAQGLEDMADIAHEIGRRNVDVEKERLAQALQETPAALSVYVAYLDGEPVASGRIHFRQNSPVAELAGGRTKTTHRNRGLFTAVVAARLTEALARHCTHVFVDALPSSEPILRKRGFQFVTHTQPFILNPTRQIAPSHPNRTQRQGQS